MVIYDNVNFKNIIRDEIFKYKIIIRNLIIAVIMICLNLSKSDFQQFIYDRTKYLNLYNIFITFIISGDDNGIGIYIFIYLILDTIRKVYLFNINTIFGGPSLLLEIKIFTVFTILKINLIVINKT